MSGECSISRNGSLRHWGCERPWRPFRQIVRRLGAGTRAPRQSRVLGGHGRTSYECRGAEGLRQAIKFLKGEKVEKTITLPTEKITKENAAAVLKANGL